LEMIFQYLQKQSWQPLVKVGLMRKPVPFFRLRTMLGGFVVLEIKSTSQIV
jgi:hypothetical protein